MPVSELWENLGASSEGLTEDDAQHRLVEYGENKITEKKVSPILKFLSYFSGPIPWMIEVAPLLLAMVQHWVDLVIVLVLLAFNAVVGFWQEHEAVNAVEALKSQLAVRVRVKRGGAWIEADAAALVLVEPGLSVIVRAVETAREIFERMNSYAIYRITETICIMFFVVLTMIVFNFYPITAVMIILLALLTSCAPRSVSVQAVPRAGVVDGSHRHSGRGSNDRRIWVVGRRFTLGLRGVGLGLLPRVGIHRGPGQASSVPTTCKRRGESSGLSKPGQGAASPQYRVVRRGLRPDLRQHIVLATRCAGANVLIAGWPETG